VLLPLLLEGDAMRKTYLIIALGVIVSFGLGFGLGAILNALSFLGPTRIVTVTKTLSDREVSRLYCR